jgi:GxxExxY protein
VGRGKPRLRLLRNAYLRCVTENQVSGMIVNAAYKVHSAVGPGLLESAYEAALAYEVGRSGLRISCEQTVPLVYEGCGWRLPFERI